MLGREKTGWISVALDTASIDSRFNKEGACNSMNWSILLLLLCPLSKMKVGKKNPNGIAYR